jgi:lysophospholipase L1-like esterase
MTRHRICSSLFLALAVGAMALSARADAGPAQEFEFQGRAYRVSALFSPGQADLQLQGETKTDLSAGMKGENVLLGARVLDDDFYIFWLNFRQNEIRLAYYDRRGGLSRLLPLTGFSFIGLPEVDEEDGRLRGLVFLGNRSDNDDIYYYEPENGSLTALTRTPFSEKGFTLLRTDGRLEIETRSLWARYRYRFDPRLRACLLVEEKRIVRARKGRAAAVTPEYYNTYIGFGDSITWGEFEGEQHLEICYLTQMKALLADPGYADYYGDSDFIDLGVPGDTTLDGAERIDDDLNDHPAFYFLLMLGVNDVIKADLSVDSSLENLSYIIDAAKARGMRVIVSTLTPSRAHFSSYAYYWKNLNELSAGILGLARVKDVASIDTLSAFMNTNPPDGWKELLERVIPEVSKGNHPNAEGHRIIASLFAPVLVSFPPLPPQNIIVVNPLDSRQRTAKWDADYESDFDHFHVEFGFQAETLNQSLDSTASYFTIHLFPFLPHLYFRVQTVDRGKRQSAFLTPGTVAAPAGDPPFIESNRVGAKKHAER